jgi:hypothetical protein
MSLDLPPILQRDCSRTFVMSQINTSSIRANDVFRSWMIVGPILNQLMQLPDIVGCHGLGICKCPSNALRYTDFVQRQIRITSNDCTCRKVYALTH